MEGKVYLAVSQAYDELVLRISEVLNCEGKHIGDCGERIYRFDTTKSLKNIESIEVHLSLIGGVTLESIKPVGEESFDCNYIESDGIVRTENGYDAHDIYSLAMKLKSFLLKHDSKSGIEDIKVMNYDTASSI